VSRKKLLFVGLALCLHLSPAAANSAGTVTTQGAVQSDKIKLIAKQPIGKCVLRVARKYHLDPYLIWAVKRVETGSSLKGDIVGHNTNGTKDVGFMQTNTIHMEKLAAYGITENDLKQPCVSIEVGGWMLATLISKHGVREGVGRYHSKTPKYKYPYIKKVFKEWLTLVRAAQDI